MKRSKFAGRLCAVSLFAGGMLMGCGGVEDPGTNPNANAKKFDTVAKINAFLEGKTLTMTGNNIPSHPNGFSEDVNFGAASQCYVGVTMKVEAGHYQVTSDLGTINNAPMTGDPGTCDHSAKSNTLSFTSTVELVENLKGDGECFDVTYTYPGFKQEGRAQLNADGSVLSLEIYFEGKATGHRCANGAVGSKTVKVAGADFSGDAVQKYVVTAN